MERSPHLKMEECVERNILNQSEVINDVFLGFKRKSILGRKDLVLEGFANVIPESQAKFFTFNLRDRITPNWDEDQIFIELPYSTNFEIFIHDPTFFTLNYIPVALPTLYLRVMVNQSESHYYTMVMTEVEELDVAQDPCNRDEKYNFQVKSIFKCKFLPKRPICISRLV